jgi:hypothetical protein
MQSDIYAAALHNLQKGPAHTALDRMNNLDFTRIEIFASR